MKVLVSLLLLITSFFYACDTAVTENNSKEKKANIQAQAVPSQASNSTQVKKTVKPIKAKSIEKDSPIIKATEAKNSSYH